MDKRAYSARLVAFAIVAVGCVLALVGSVRPHYDTGYHLHAGILFAGLTPYLLYAVLTQFVRGPFLVAIGGAVLLINVLVLMG